MVRRLTTNLTVWSRLVCLLIVLLPSMLPTTSAGEKSRIRSAFSSTSLEGLQNVTIHFIDVGMGDSIFIETSGRNVLIDGGLPEAGQAVKSYLEDLSVTRIDLMIATHPHEDHVGGLITVLNSGICVDQVLTNNDTMTNFSQDLYLAFLALAEGHNMTIACRGQIYTLTETANLTVLNPIQPLEFNPVKPYGEIDEHLVNDNSIVVKLQVGEISFLLTGDAEALAEQSMLEANLDLRSDVLKLGHHGISDGTTIPFLNEVSPSHAIATARMPNKYGEAAPSAATVYRLLSRNITVLGTHFCGTIRIATNGASMFPPEFQRTLPRVELPAQVDGKLSGLEFMVDLAISDLDIAQRFVGLEFRMSFNHTLLKILNVTAGSFINDTEWNKNGVSITCVIDETCNQVVIGLKLLPSRPGFWGSFPHGNGTLATMAFKAMYQERGYDKLVGYFKQPSTCSLKIFSSNMVNDAHEFIPHETEDGSYVIWPTNIADCSNDGYVGIDDILGVALAFGTDYVHPRWNPLLDLNGDGSVDIYDIWIAAYNFGWGVV